jgi:cystathionine gamma-synthase
VKPETLAIHAARSPDSDSGAVALPLHLSTTFERAADGSYPRGFYYARAANPTRKALEGAIAALEGGAESLCFASGSAASMAAFSLLAPGDHVIAPAECYHGTVGQLRQYVQRIGVGVSLVETWNTAAIETAWTPATRLLWIETPSNPRLYITDIAATAGLAHARGALLACDSTLATPVLQRPLEQGADIVMHSTTKFLAGHSDVTGGALVVRERGAVLDALRNYQLQAGAVPSPFDCWLIRRSMMTLHQRVRAQSASAGLVADFLRQHPRVAQVFYPGLEAHPGHDLATRQMSGFGSMISLTVHGGADEALAVAARTRVFSRATSLGSVESLIEHRASMEGPGTRTPASLLRLSIGLEHVSDLIDDLEQALR